MNFVEKLIPVNEFSRPGKMRSVTRNVVWHYTANPGATAMNHFHYFGETIANQNPNDNVEDTYASAHLFVDRTTVLTIIPLDEIAYHASNANPYSIGVELCIEKDGSFHADTIRQAVELGAYLFKRYGVKPTDYLRHYDVTGKICPKPWVDNPASWTAFKQQVSDAINGKGVRTLNWTDNQWDMFAKALNDLYHASVGGQLAHPVYSDYTWAEKAYKHELTVDEVLFLQGIMFARSQGIDV